VYCNTRRAFGPELLQETIMPNPDITTYWIQTPNSTRWFQIDVFQFYAYLSAMATYPEIFKGHRVAAVEITLPNPEP
jgi:hypothetical protein